MTNRQKDIFSIGFNIVVILLRVIGIVYMLSN